MAAEHTIVITFDAQQRLVPVNSRNLLAIEETHRVEPGDKIKWVSPHGEVNVVFNSGSGAENDNSPLESGSKGGKQFRRVLKEVQKPTAFPYKCTVTDKKGSRFGWPEKDDGGGSVEVIPLRT